MVSNPEMKRLRGARFAPASTRGTNPNRKNTAVAAKAIVMALVINNRKVPPATSRRFIAKPIPTAQTGGIKAVAIATPGSAAEILGIAKAKAAALPPASATARSIGPGRVRVSTSLGISSKIVNGSCRLPNVINTEMITARTAPRNKPTTPSRSKRPSPVIDANPMPIMGDISGATSIAPMMMAGELTNNPIVAMMLDKITNR